MLLLCFFVFPSVGTWHRFFSNPSLKSLTIDELFQRWEVRMMTASLNAKFNKLMAQSNVQNSAWGTHAKRIGIVSLEVRTMSVWYWWSFVFPSTPFDSGSVGREAWRSSVYCCKHDLLEIVFRRPINTWLFGEWWQWCQSAVIPTYNYHQLVGNKSLLLIRIQSRMPQTRSDM